MARAVAERTRLVTQIHGKSLPDPDESPTIPLWANDEPCAAKPLGLSRSGAFRAASRGEIPGAMRFGNQWRVATATLRRALGLDLSGPSDPDVLRDTEDPVIYLQPIADEAVAE